MKERRSRKPFGQVSQTIINAYKDLLTFMKYIVAFAMSTPTLGAQMEMKIVCREKSR